MRRRRSLIVLLGAATFVAAHAIEVAAQIGGAEPWFISTMPSALFTTGSLFVAGVVVGVRARGPFLDAYASALLLTAGAAVPLVITLFTNRAGPGNLFPIALMLGIVALGISALAGTAGGWLIRRSIG